MSSPALLVLADDLTGANDAGVQFAEAGIRSIVLADHDVSALPKEFAVVVVNTETRHLSSARAAERVKRLAYLGTDSGVKWFYKKTDSTLRGNIGAELQALCEATEQSFLPFVPALPELGRTTCGGIHFVHGRPIGETAFARDPLNPVRHSRVTDLLQSQTNLPLASITADQIASAPPGIAVIDCISIDDLRHIADGLAASNRLSIVSGSVALAKFIVPHLDLKVAPPDAPDPRGPILLVNGSLHERALGQVACGVKHFSKLRLQPEQILGKKANLCVPSGGGHLLVCSVEQTSDLDAFRSAASAHSLAEHELHLRVAERTGQLVHALLAAGVYRTLVVFGGDTMAGIARANGWRSFVPLGEAEPGISVSVPSHSGLTLISKAGGFGDEGVVERIVEYVMTKTHPP